MDMDIGAIGVALVAGSLATFNPCGFGLLPAFVSLQMTDLPSEDGISSRVSRGLEVGVTVAAGFLTVFTAAAVPVALGATALAAYFSWAGLLVGLSLIVVALMGLSGKHIGFSTRRRTNVPPTRPSLVAFGMGYGTASLGCTLPVLLALIGAATTSGSALAPVGTFAAYGLGTMITLVAIAVTVAGARAGLVVRIKRLIPHMHRLGNVLLLVAGVYVTYYWAQILLRGAAGSTSDPVIRVTTRVAAALERTWAAYGVPLILITASISLVAVGAMLALRTGRSRSGSPER
ncbi:MAG: cytochrome c biogenesis protein CcdA [Actinomycetota bacterium]|nr:cytochrome c biogenesis protein CcdA [Actinomycetota bacterium]